MQTLYKTIPQGKSLLYGWFEAMHTRIDVILCNVTEEKGKELIKSILQKTEEISRLVNRFDETSELAYVNRDAFEKEICLSPALFNLIKYSIEGSHFTHGCFDITIQSPVTYREGPEGIYLNPAIQTIRFLHPDIRLDLCGIAKGYALDECRMILLAEGIENLFISFGNSSIVGWGNHPNGMGWLVSGRENSYLPPIHLQNECLTISGNESQERKHLLSPFSKSYITGKKEVAVKTPNGQLGEILSTAWFVADPDMKKRLEEEHKKNAIFYS